MKYSMKLDNIQETFSFDKKNEKKKNKKEYLIYQNLIY